MIEQLSPNTSKWWCAMKSMRARSGAGYPGELKIFILASLINSTGSALMLPLTTLYVHTHFGRSLAEAGFAILIQSLGGIIGQLLGGSLYHRIGVKPLLVGSLGTASLCLFSLMFTHELSDGWIVYLITIALVGLSTSVSFPAIQAFVGFRWAERRGELFNTIYVWNNVGFALGTALSGVLADISFKFTFGLNGVATLGFAVFFYIFLGRIERQGISLRVDYGANTVDRPSRGQRRAEMLRLLGAYRLYAFIGLGSLLVWFSNSIWGAGVAPHLYAQGLGLSAFSLLWTLNGILIFVGQPLTSFMKRLALKSVHAQLIAGAAFYGLGYVSIVINQSYASMMVGMVLLTIGEMLFAPAVPAFIAGHSGNDSPFYLGLVGGIGSAGRLFGPYMLGATYDAGGLLPATWVAIGAACLAIMAFSIHQLLQNQRRISPGSGTYIS